MSWRKEQRYAKALELINQMPEVYSQAEVAKAFGMSHGNFQYFEAKTILKLMRGLKEATKGEIGL